MKRMMLGLGVALTICSPATAFTNWECKTETGESVGIFEEKMVHVGINRDVTEYMCDGNVVMVGPIILYGRYITSVTKICRRERLRYCFTQALVG